MTVAELIAVLRDMPQDAIVLVDADFGFDAIEAATEIRVVENTARDLDGQWVSPLYGQAGVPAVVLGFLED